MKPDPKKEPAEEAPHHSQTADVEPLVVSAITQQTRYRHQLVLDIDFSVQNPIRVVHSCNTDMLYMSIVSLGSAPSVIPAVTFDDTNSLTLYGSIGNTSRYRVFITVVPQ